MILPWFLWSYGAAAETMLCPGLGALDPAVDLLWSQSWFWSRLCNRIIGL